jgi:hypothetical protein
VAGVSIRMDWNEKAFESAGQTVREMLALATGVIALTVSFAGDLIPRGSRAVPWMTAAWITLSASIFFGILTLMAITGNLSRAAKTNTPPDPFAKNIIVFANLQVWLCFLGLLLTIRFGAIALNSLP